MTPLPGTRMIPTDWSSHHAGIVGTSMNGAAYVTDPARTTPGAWNPETGERGAPTLYPVAGTKQNPIPCRIQRLASANQTQQTEQVSTDRRYLIQLHDPGLDLADLEEGHVVHVTTAPNDPNLVGLPLYVEDVQHGTERFTRDLVAVHNQQPESA